MLTKVNTTKKEELRVVVEQAMMGRRAATVVADVVMGEILAAPGLDLAAHRLAKLGSYVKTFALMALLTESQWLR
jgi:hypothetical protein